MTKNDFLRDLVKSAEKSGFVINSRIRVNPLIKDAWEMGKYFLPQYQFSIIRHLVQIFGGFFFSYFPGKQLLLLK